MSGILVIVLLLLTCSGIPLVGRGGLGSFNPYTLEYRTQSEYTFGDIPIYRSTPVRRDNDLLIYLVRNHIIESVPGERWESVFHWNTAWKDGYGKWHDVLVRRRHELIEWTEANPDLAHIYWTEIFARARSDWQADQEIGNEILTSRRLWKSVAELRETIHDIESDTLVSRRISLELGHQPAFPGELAKVNAELKALRARPEPSSRFTLHDVFSALVSLFPPWSRWW